MNWGQIGVNPATIAREPASAVQPWMDKGLVNGHFWLWSQRDSNP